MLDTSDYHNYHNYHNYHKNKEFFKKTEVVEFYWLNSLPNRFNNQKTISEVEARNCMHCRFSMS